MIGYLLLDTTIETPLAPCPATFINPEMPLMVVPILRAGPSLDGRRTVCITHSLCVSS